MTEKRGALHSLNLQNRSFIIGYCLVLYSGNHFWGGLYPSAGCRILIFLALRKAFCRVRKRKREWERERESEKERVSERQTDRFKIDTKARTFMKTWGRGFINRYIQTHAHAHDLLTTQKHMHARTHLNLTYLHAFLLTYAHSYGVMNTLTDTNIHP